MVSVANRSERGRAKGADIHILANKSHGRVRKDFHNRQLAAVHQNSGRACQHQHGLLACQVDDLAAEDWREIISAARIRAAGKCALQYSIFGIAARY